MQQLFGSAVKVKEVPGGVQGEESIDHALKEDGAFCVYDT
jgi:hypothetical protein